MNLVTDLEMAASITFSSILSEIQFLTFNFKIEMIPFAAFITLKKSPLKEKYCTKAMPSAPILFLLHQAQQEIHELKHKTLNY